MTDPRPIQRMALGQFLRAHREQLSPLAFGLPAGRRRRTPGLRREEVAQLCGFSATWYTWIEQGRDVSVSSASLDRLAKALGFARAERTYLFELAGKRDPDPLPLYAVHDLPADCVAVITSISAPAYLLDRTWTARAWTPAAYHLFTGWLDDDPNLVRFIFLQPSARSLIVDWEKRARRIVAELRADFGKDINEPNLKGLVEDMVRLSPQFARWWNQQTVIDREGGERTFQHPTDGFLRYLQTTFVPAHHPDTKLVVLTPAPGLDGRPGSDGVTGI